MISSSNPIKKAGNAIFPSTFDVLKQSAFDVRINVATVNDLTNSATWQSHDDKYYLYNGLVVGVVENHQLYMLVNYNDNNNTWQNPILNPTGTNPGWTPITLDEYLKSCTFADEKLTIVDQSDNPTEVDLSVYATDADLSIEITNRTDADTILQEEINNLKARGRFLSLWDSNTGYPFDDPTPLPTVSEPYKYNAGDYYIIGRVGKQKHTIHIKGTGLDPEGVVNSYDITFILNTDTDTEFTSLGNIYAELSNLKYTHDKKHIPATGTFNSTQVNFISAGFAGNTWIILFNGSDRIGITYGEAASLTDTKSSSDTYYKPSGIEYTGEASSVIESDIPCVDDVYYYTGSAWNLQHNTHKDIGFVNIAGDPYDNTNLKNALDSKQDKFTDGSATIASESNDIITLKGGISQTGGSIANSGTDITLAKVAKTGSYSDLSGLPTIVDEKVKQTLGSTDTTYPLLASAQSSPTSGTSYEAIYDSGIKINPNKHSVVEGYATDHGILTASGIGSYASGYAEEGNIKATGKGAHAAGYAASDHIIEASGDGSHAEGCGTTASGDAAHAEGSSSVAGGTCSHAEGCETTAVGNYSHTEGYSNTITSNGTYSHAEGQYNTINNYASHVEGVSNEINSIQTHIEGAQNFTPERNKDGSVSVIHVEGQANRGDNNQTHAEGYSTVARGNGAHTEGWFSHAIGDGSHAEGNHGHGQIRASRSSTSSIKYSFNLGDAPSEEVKSVLRKLVVGDYVIINPSSAQWTMYNSRIESISNNGDDYTIVVDRDFTSEDTEFYIIVALGGCAKGNGSHVEGHNTNTAGHHSHAEGSNTLANKDDSHAEGSYTVADGIVSHAEGHRTKTSGYAAHAEGKDTTASGEGSHAEGQWTIAKESYQHVQGVYNADKSDAAFIIGNGSDNTSRSNAFTVDWNGKTMLDCVEYNNTSSTEHSSLHYFATDGTRQKLDFYNHEVIAKTKLSESEHGDKAHKLTILCNLNGLTLNAASDSDFIRNYKYNITNDYIWTKSTITTENVYAGILEIDHASATGLFDLIITETGKSTETYRVGFVINDTPLFPYSPQANYSDGVFTYVTNMKYNIIPRFRPDTSASLLGFLELPKEFIGTVTLKPICITLKGQGEPEPIYMFNEYSSTKAGLIAWDNGSITPGYLQLITQSDFDNISSNWEKYGVSFNYKPFNSSGSPSLPGSGEHAMEYYFHFLNQPDYPFLGKYQVDLFGNLGTLNVGDKVSDILVNDTLLHTLLSVVATKLPEPNTSSAETYYHKVTIDGSGIPTYGWGSIGGGGGGSVPIGTIMMWPTSNAPDGWLFCDGTEAQSQALKNVLGTNIVPNFKRRFPLGAQNGLWHCGNQTYNTALGESEGEEAHLLTPGESATLSHTHDFIKKVIGMSVLSTSNTKAFTTLSDSGTDETTTVGEPATTETTKAHNNIPPYLAVNFIIKY